MYVLRSVKWRKYGVSGSVAYMFDHTATFGVEGKSVDEVLETLMEQDIDVRDVVMTMA